MIIMSTSIFLIIIFFTLPSPPLHSLCTLPRNAWHVRNAGCILADGMTVTAPPCSSLFILCGDTAIGCVHGFTRWQLRLYCLRCPDGCPEATGDFHLIQRYWHNLMGKEGDFHLFASVLTSQYRPGVHLTLILHPSLLWSTQSNQGHCTMT